VTYRRNGDARERATDAPIARLIDRPAPGVTQAALIGTLVAHLAGWGNAYIGKFRDETGAVAQLAPLPPDQVNVQIVGGQPFYSYADPTGRQAVYTTTDIVHIRSLSLDGRLGVSPIRQAREDLGLAAAVRDSGAAFYGTKGTLVCGDSTYKMFDLKNEAVGANEQSGRGDAGHVDNFLRAIRGDAALAAEIEEGHKSTLLCHLANIAWRTGSTVNLDPQTHRIIGNKDADTLWSREYRKGWEPKV